MQSMLPVQWISGTALENFVTIVLYKLTFTLPYHSSCKNFVAVGLL